MSTPTPSPRLPSRSAAGSDTYTWLGVIWLLLLAGGFLALMGLILPVINFPVLLGILGFVGLNVLGHLILGRWVARRIAASAADRENDFE